MSYYYIINFRIAVEKSLNRLILIIYYHHCKNSYYHIRIGDVAHLAGHQLPGCVLLVIIINYLLLDRLGTNFLDAYYIHSPLATPGQRAKVWEDMAKLKKEGLIRACGVV